MNAKLLLAVAAGGALGSVARYLTMSLMGRWFGDTFPWGTLTVNVVGSFVIGAIIEGSALRWNVGPELRALLVVGILGGFTTFSTFSLDIMFLIERHSMTAALQYVFASVAIGVTAIYLGMAAVRLILPAPG